MKKARLAFLLLVAALTGVTAACWEPIGLLLLGRPPTKAEEREYFTTRVVDFGTGGKLVLEPGPVRRWTKDLVPVGSWRVTEVHQGLTNRYVFVYDFQGSDLEMRATQWDEEGKLIQQVSEISGNDPTFRESPPWLWGDTDIVVEKTVKEKGAVR